MSDRLERDALLRRIVEIAADTGEIWMRAAEKFTQTDVTDEDAAFFFHRGLAVEAQSFHRRQFSPSNGFSDSDEMVEQYVQDALQRLFQSADGQMKAVFQFMIEDDDAALERLAEDIAGRHAQITFFSTSRETKRRHRVQRISELPPKEQERLRAMAAATW
jgi:hypothetical protein